MTRRNFLRATAACSVAVPVASKVCVITDINHYTKKATIEWMLRNAHPAQAECMRRDDPEVFYGGGYGLGRISTGLMHSIHQYNWSKT